MIVRILAEGQFEVDDAELDELNVLDDAVEASLDGPDAAFRAALVALLDRVRAVGTAVPDEELVASDVVLPFAGATQDEVRELLTDEGLIPG